MNTFLRELSILRKAPQSVMQARAVKLFIDDTKLIVNIRQGFQRLVPTQKTEYKNKKKLSIY